MSYATAVNWTYINDDGNYKIVFASLDETFSIYWKISRVLVHWNTGVLISTVAQG